MASRYAFSTCRLEELCEINIGKTPSRSNPIFWNGTHPWLSIADMNQGRNLTHTKERITAEGVVSSGIKEVTTGTLLLSYKLSIGKVGITQKNLYTNEAIAALPILDSSVLDINFLYWTLKTIDLLETSDKAAMGKTLNKAKLRQLQIPLPPLEEQKRIAGILDAADILRAKRREALARLDDLLQSTFLDMFGDPVTNPKGWEVKTFGETVEKMHQGINTAADKVRYVEVGAPIIQAKHIVADGISLEGVKFLGKSDREKYFSKYVPKQWDILFSNIGTIGRSSIFTETKELFFAWNVFGIRPNHTLVNVFYMKAFLDYLETVNFFDRYLTGGTVKFVSKKVLGSIMLPLPPLELQRRFAEIVSSVEEQKAKMRKHLEQLDDLFASLQQRAFRGDL